MDVRLYAWQRLTAVLMVPLLLLHVAVILYATGNGLTAAEILARTRGSLLWAVNYGVLVAAASVHAGIGIRSVLIEWTPLAERAASLVATGIGVLLLGLGWRAVVAVVWS
jgi:fumarate reductase subunit C